MTNRRIASAQESAKLRRQREIGGNIVLFVASAKRNIPFIDEETLEVKDFPRLHNSHAR